MAEQTVCEKCGLFIIPDQVHICRAEVSFLTKPITFDVGNPANVLLNL